MATASSLPSIRHPDSIPSSTSRAHLADSLDLHAADGMPSLQPPHTAGIQQPQSTLPLSSQSTFDDGTAASGDSSRDITASSSLSSQGKRRRLSKDAIKPEFITISVGQTGLRQPPNTDVTRSSSPSSDKKRNKLGYHRTSVACGHCRRRKIRCLVATDDHLGRCSNCIRLKKECNFYPVDQEGPNKNGGLGAPRAYGALTINTAAGLPLGAQHRDLGLSTSEVGASPYYHPLGSIGSENWSGLSQFGASSSNLRQSISGDSSSGYWSHNPSSAGSVSSSIGNRSGVASILPSSPDSSFPYPQSQMPWGNQRSVSFSHVENLPSYQQYTLPNTQSSLGLASYSFPIHSLSSSRASAEETVPATLPSSTVAPQMPSSYQVQPWESSYSTPSQQPASTQYSPDSTRTSFNTTPWTVGLDEERDPHQR